VTVAEELRAVKPIESRALPNRFDLPHAVAFQFHDILAALVVDLEAARAFHAPFDLQPGEEHELHTLQGEDLWRWLEASGRNEVIADLTYRQLTAALTADACHFLCESLLTSGKGKLTVAFSLLRKPLKENLLLLEWLLGDPSDFLDHFDGVTPRAYSPNRIPVAKRREILKKAYRELGNPGIDEDFLWDVRYARDKPYSLELLWTQATHLVTTMDGVATDPGNLNFVFSSPTARSEQWHYYYLITPLLLHYMIQVVEAVVGRFIEWNSPKRTIQLFLRSLALARATEATSTGQARLDSVDELLDELSRAVSGSCDGCGAGLSFARETVDNLWLTAVVPCPTCGFENDLWGGLFGNGAAANGT